MTLMMNEFSAQLLVKVRVYRVSYIVISSTAAGVIVCNFVTQKSEKIFLFRVTSCEPKQSMSIQCVKIKD